jgi:hypothetical protein
VLRTGGLAVEDVQFISQGTAGRLPGLVTGQIDGVALHPEDFFLATQKKPGIHALVDLAKVLPDFVFNSYGASSEWIARDRALLRDTAAAMIEANRIIYRDKAKVVPIMVSATQSTPDAVAHAWDVLTKNCVWAINEGFERKRTDWTVDYDVSVGDIDKDHKPSFEQVVNLKLASEAVAAAGGPVKIGNCTE